MFEAIVAGHLCVDLIPRLTASVEVAPGSLVAVGPLAMRPGGCVANTGNDLAQLGAKVRCVADVGDDELGVTLLRLLNGGPADTSAVRTVPGATTSYSVVVEPPGRDRMFWHHVGANAIFDGRRVDLSSGDLLHVGYPPILPATLSHDASPLRGLLRRSRERGLTNSVDLAVVPPESQASHNWERILRLTLPLVDVLTPSVDDLASMFHAPVDPSRRGLSSLAARLIAQGAGVVLLTAGSRGLRLHTAGQARLAGGGRVLAPLAERWASREIWLPASRAEIRTTTGAGDAATAGLLYGLLAGLGPDEAAKLAATAGALKVAGHRTLPAFGDGSPYGIGRAADPEAQRYGHPR